MSITGLLTQISPYLLTKLKITPSIIELFKFVSTTDDEVPKIDNLYGLSSERTNLLREILPVPEQIIGHWTLRDLEVIQSWKDRYPEDYDHLTTDIDRIVKEGKTNPSLDLYQDWHFISYICTGYVSMEVMPFLIEEENFRVNAVLGGQMVDEFTRCLEYEEVRQVAQALSIVTEEVIRQRFVQSSSVKSNLYSFWQEEDYDEFLKFCFDIKEFYNDAGNRKNGLLIEIV